MIHQNIIKMKEEVFNAFQSIDIQDINLSIYYESGKLVLSFMWNFEGTAPYSGIKIYKEHKSFTMKEDEFSAKLENEIAPFFQKEVENT
jgi:hypothetical protein